MKYATSIIVVSMLALTPMSADAGQTKGSGSANQAQQAVETRSQAQHTDRRHETEQSRDHIRSEEYASPRDRDIYGSELMTAVERDRYREQLRQQTSEQARAQYQQQHEKAMQQRARQEGKDLVPPGQGPVYGGELMTVEERNAYREQLRHIASDEERVRFEAQHQEQMNQRARALRLDIEEAE